jgi:hypothetical protein
MIGFVLTCLSFLGGPEAPALPPPPPPPPPIVAHEEAPQPPAPPAVSDPPCCPREGCGERTAERSQERCAAREGGGREREKCRRHIFRRRCR